MHLIRQLIIYLFFTLQCYLVHSRGKRIEIFSQESGSDMAQVRQQERTAARNKNVMFNVLPRNSPLKWSKVRDSQANYVIPYTISGQYDYSERNIISDAMGRIEANTCIRFNKRTFEKDFIDLQNQQNEGCYTNVGRLSGKNIVMLEANELATCVEVDIVIHELMHAIGLWHEHMRYDRDKYITVHYENIEPVYMSQFEKISPQESTTYGVPYDYKSVMHYTETAFARRGRISMETKDPQYQKIIGNQKDASPSDYKKICILYGCSSCMGEAFDPDNPTSMVKPSPPPPQPAVVQPQGGNILPAVTYSPGESSSSECQEMFSIFCQRMAKSERLNCNYFSSFCECTCRNVPKPLPPQPPPPQSSSSGFFNRVWSFFGRN